MHRFVIFGCRDEIMINTEEMDAQRISDSMRFFGVINPVALATWMHHANRGDFFLEGGHMILCVSGRKATSIGKQIAHPVGNDKAKRLRNTKARITSNK